MRELGLVCVAGVLALCIGCAPTGAMRVNAAQAAAEPGNNDSAGTAAAMDVTSPQDLARLNKLWSERTASSNGASDYPIGPADILSIAEPDIRDMNSTVRVSALGTIDLPLVGRLRAAGLTEAQLEQELNDKLQKYMFHPQATVFVKAYRNRQVAVVGSVNRPGLITLISPSETLLDVITRAGGLSPQAADQVVLIPSESGNEHLVQQIAQVALPAAPAGAGGQASSFRAVTDSDSAAHPADGASADASSADAAGGGASAADGMARVNQPIGPSQPVPPGAARMASKVQSAQPAPADDAAANALAILPTNARPVTISLKSTSLTGAGRFMNLPVRPGDVIVVPGGGNVMVVGWVQHPGYFQVGSGLTVLGAIGAAGGPMYAANTKDVTLIRSEPNGKKLTVAINLEDISDGKEQDLPVKANDVIDVPYSELRIGPYIFYNVISRMGVMGPAIPY
ncbi:MAG: polysaccharide biosynthesis/export family protein [Candidatus Binataceae bacterium]